MDENCRSCVLFHIHGATCSCDLDFPPSPPGKPGLCDHKIRMGLDAGDLREDVVEVLVSADRKVLWINLSDRCVLRIQDVKKLHVEYLEEK